MTLTQTHKPCQSCSAAFGGKYMTNFWATWTLWGTHNSGRGEKPQQATDNTTEAGVGQRSVSAPDCEVSLGSKSTPAE